MYISEIFTVVGYLHTAGFKNRWGINFVKCRSWERYIDSTVKDFVYNFFHFSNLLEGNLYLGYGLLVKFGSGCHGHGH